MVTDTNGRRRVTFGDVVANLVLLALVAPFVGAWLGWGVLIFRAVTGL